MKPGFVERAMVDCLDAESQSIKGKIAEVGLARAEGQYNTFNITLSMVLESKSLTYDEGEQLMKQYKKVLLGKDVEIAAIVFPCPVCGKGFSTERGMKQHVRMVHEKKRKAKKETPRKKGRSTRKQTSRRKSSKKAAMEE